MRLARYASRRPGALALLYVLAALGCLAGPPAARGALAPESLASLEFVSDAQISPDGRRIVYVVTRVRTDTDAYDSDLWLIDGDGEPRPLVVAAGEDSRPRWSPDGRRLAFVSSRSGKRQIHVLDMARGGESRQLTREPQGVGSFAWSPDGARIAYQARSPDASAPDPDGAEKRKAGRPYVTERLFYRMDGSPGFRPETSGVLRVVSSDPDAEAPALTLTDGRSEPSEPAWSSDGEWIVFSTIPHEDRAQIEGDSELYRVRADGSGTVEPLTARRGPDANPIVGAGGLVAWTGYDAGDTPRSATSTELYVMRLDGREPRSLTRDLDRNVTETVMTDAAAPRSSGRRMAFSADGRSVLFVAADRGRTVLFRVNTRGGPAQRLSDGLRGDLREFSVARNGRIAAIFGSPTQPYEVWTLDRPGQEWRRRTSHGIASLGGFQPVPYEELWVESFDGRRIQGWLLKPPGFDPTRKHPLILYIHGGPHALYGESFFHEFQLLADAGYLVLITNPRGSTGYGQEFANVIQYRYPGDDYRDLMAALDHVIARGYVDERRLGVAGGSGGGVLASWTIGHTDRFAAALVERPVVNWLSFAAAADLHAFFVRHWFRDYPWRDAADYLERSPLSYVDRVKTPVLVIQSEHDYRTPMDQGLQYYSALRMLGKPARLAFFPTSSHGLSREGPPSQRIERLAIILGWFDEKLRGG